VTSDTASEHGAAVRDVALVPIGARRSQRRSANSFFHEDLADQQEAGYLRLAVPAEPGGLGLTVPEFVRENTRLAYRARSTALAINMHL